MIYEIAILHVENTFECKCHVIFLFQGNTKPSSVDSSAAYGRNVSNKSKESDLRLLTELDSDHMYEAVLLINNRLSSFLGNDVDAMQATELGDSRVGKSMPRFKPVSKFVQILNVGDHWITVTNFFGETTQDVYVYDSLFQTLSSQTVVQVTSLLRNEHAEDIVFHLRCFDRQPGASRLC